MIFRKTACLFSVCMRMGAILGGATPEQEESLAQYGRNLGMAFQIVDDVLDLTASEEVLGKPVASDLREGKVTMAVIHALEQCTPQERKTDRDGAAGARIRRRHSPQKLSRSWSATALSKRQMLVRCNMRRWHATQFAVSRTARLSGRCCGRRNSLSPGRSEEDRRWSLVVGLTPKKFTS